jgi:shikimate kinase
MPGRNKVYIIGFMGSGKTTTGRKLASMLGWSFTDLDLGIEKHTGMTIPQIFSEKGEAYFREVEADMLRKLHTATRTVISTGGGAPVYSDNMDYMLETGLTIYLKLTPGQLKTRLAASDGERPLITKLNDEELLSFIEDKLQFREKWYSRAELTVSGFDTDMRAIFSEVQSRINL